MSQKFLHHMNSMSKRDECMFSSRLHALHILSTVCVWAPVAGSTKLTECVVAITYPLQANVCPPLITVNDTSRFYETLGIVEWLHFSLVTFTWKLSPVICSIPPKYPRPVMSTYLPLLYFRHPNLLPSISILTPWPPMIAGWSMKYCAQMSLVPIHCCVGWNLITINSSTTHVPRGVYM